MLLRRAPCFRGSSETNPVLQEEGGPVDETLWLTATRPEAMLQFLRKVGDPSERRCRLFACACVRRIWRLVDPTRQETVAVAERFADGRATVEELIAARDGTESAVAARLRGHAFSAAEAANCTTAYWEPLPDDPSKPGWHAALISSMHAKDAAVKKAAADVRKLPVKGGTAMRVALEAEFNAQAILLRDLFGLWPLRPPPSLDPTWLAWHHGTVRKLAEVIYEQRAFETMPLLADALEEAGCGDPGLLGHLRGYEPHARGCWGLDLVLGKK